MTDTRKHQRLLKISQAADVELEAAKDLMEQLRPFDPRPSASVAIEFMAHILKHAFEAGHVGTFPKFSPKTRIGRKQAPGTGRPPSPQKIRDSLGLVSPVQRRKL